MDRYNAAKNRTKACNQRRRKLDDSYYYFANYNKFKGLFEQFESP